MEKDYIRDMVKARKRVLTDTEKKCAAEEVFGRLENNAAFMAAGKILLYHSLPDELPTHDFIDRWHTRKRLFLPRVNGMNLEILPYDRKRLASGAFHIEEPSGDDITDVSEIELAVVPGIAFDREGNRVGRGKGYYDRLLPGIKALKIGVCFDFQYIEEGIEAEEHDARVDIVITPSKTIITRRKQLI